MRATTATGPKPYVSLKLDPTAIPDLPAPRPAYEIWVYSPQVEGVHLRFGSVARGGLRWSDRREDFRTEILGLVKAQMVKNAVIVPTGSKGGFYAKKLPDPTVSREAWLEEGTVGLPHLHLGAARRHRQPGRHRDRAARARRAPRRRRLLPRRRRGQGHGDVLGHRQRRRAVLRLLARRRLRLRWLGRLRPQGHGHHRPRRVGVGQAALPRDGCRLASSEDFTVVGVGDMSGDVFGNGMLLSEHIRLVAAFDHRHVFVDPEPVAAQSFAERKRLFELPRSSWDDYDRSLISAGGGVFSRSLKSIAITPQMRAALGLPDDVDDDDADRAHPRGRCSPPVDLLWNGGIGTYVKASTEDHLSIGDRANDAIRVDGKELRVKVVGEGGNLGLSQLGRIEAALSGVRVNTDAIDNSAGVDTSDHEVNIKILLGDVVRRGDLTTRGAQHAARVDDRRRRRARAARQLRAERPPRQRPRAGAVHGAGARAAHGLARGARRARPRAGVPAERRRDRQARRPRASA